MRQVSGKTFKPDSANGPRVPVGIPGFDELTGGGLPAGSSIMVLGEPGAGKTIFASQFLINGLSRFGENGLFVSFPRVKLSSGEFRDLVSPVDKESRRYVQEQILNSFHTEMI